MFHSQSKQITYSLVNNSRHILLRFCDVYLPSLSEIFERLIPEHLTGSDFLPPPPSLQFMYAAPPEIAPFLLK